MSDILGDKEVGELWREIWLPRYAQDLIRKLVEERRRYYQASKGVHISWAVTATFDDFGIDPETWK